MHKAVFLDRDGVINADYGYIGSIDKFDLLDSVPEALARLRQHGYMLVLITNQSGIARGFYTMADHLKVTAFMQQELDLFGARFDAVKTCPHHPKAELEAYRTSCNCRKPAPGMILEAASELEIDLKHSVMVGDRVSDLLAGHAAGIKQLILVGNHPDGKQKLKEQQLDCSYYADLPAFVRDFLK